MLIDADPACISLSADLIQEGTKCTLNKIPVTATGILLEEGFSKVIEVSYTDPSTKNIQSSAVKLITTDDDTTKQTAILESSLLNKLSHQSVPNVAKINWDITDTTQDGKTVAIGMEQYTADVDFVINYSDQMLQQENIVEIMYFASKLAFEMSSSLDIINNNLNVTLKDINPSNIIIIQGPADEMTDFHITVSKFKFYLTDFGVAQPFKCSQDVCSFKGSLQQFPALLYEWMQHNHGSIEKWTQQMLAVNWDMYTLYMTILEILIVMGEKIPDAKDTFWLPEKIGLHPISNDDEILMDTNKYQQIKNDYFSKAKKICHQGSSTMAKGHICDILNHLGYLIQDTTDVKQYQPKKLSWTSDKLFWDKKMTSLSKLLESGYSQPYSLRQLI